METEKRHLIAVLENRIAFDEAMADQIDRTAMLTDGRDDPARLAALRTVIRDHRIRAMPMRGHLASLQED